MTTYGLIGYPLAHSFSAKYFTEKFHRQNIDAVYNLYPLPAINLLPEVLADHSLAGLNVTSPYKEAVVPMLSTLSEAAEAIGAVNVIAIDRRQDGAPLLHGYNSDAAGFASAYAHILRDAGRSQTALILGTGGAAKAAAYALRGLGFDVVFVSRSPGSDRIAYDRLTNEYVASAGAIVQATPLGMLGHAAGAPPIPYDAIRPCTVCIDLIYNPARTLFMARAEEAGAIVAGGLAMLHAQAEEAWRIWTHS